MAGGHRRLQAQLTLRLARDFAVVPELIVPSSARLGVALTPGGRLSAAELLQGPAEPLVDPRLSSVGIGELPLGSS
jgi:hypothetical protein